jgi:Fringe-like
MMSQPTTLRGETTMTVTTTAEAEEVSSTGLEESVSRIKGVIPAPAIEEGEEEARQQKVQLPVIDFLSVGSRRRLDQMRAQQNTFGKHAMIRTFFNATEADHVGSEQRCDQLLERQDFQKILTFCRTRTGITQTQRRWRQAFASPKYLAKKSNPAGWLCAQTRPVMGLYKALSHYHHQQQKQDLPDFLILSDDDTFWNLDLLADKFMEYKKHESIINNNSTSNNNNNNNNNNNPPIWAGCLLTPHTMTGTGFTYIPHGGFGLVLSRASIERLMKPIPCRKQKGRKTNTTNTTNTTTTMVCGIQNTLGEQRLFQPGMSLGDVIYAYATTQPFTQINNATIWSQKSRGYCMNSDWCVVVCLNWNPSLHVHTYISISFAFAFAIANFRKRSFLWLVLLTRLWGYFFQSYHYFDLRVLNDYSDHVMFKGNRSFGIGYCDRRQGEGTRGCRSKDPLCHYATPQIMKQLHNNKL